MNSINANLGNREQINGTLTSDNQPMTGTLMMSRTYTVPTDLADLGDVTLTNPQNNQVLKYNGSKWVNGEGGSSQTINAYKTVTVDDTELVASGEDEITFVAGSNITISADEETKEITINSTSGGSDDYTELSNKPKINNVELTGNKTSADLGLADPDDIPTKTSDLTNDSNFISDNSYVHTDNNYTDSDKSAVGNIANKVDKVDGKGLSTVDFTDTNYVHTDNNYTTTEKTKLSGLKSVSWTQNTTTGTKIAEINIGGTKTDVYAPTSGSGGTTDYNDLSNKPSINGVSLTGNKTSSDLGIDIPTALSDLTDDSTHRLVTDAEKTSWNGKMDTSDQYITSVNDYYFSVSNITTSNKRLDFSQYTKNYISELDATNRSKGAVLQPNGNLQHFEWRNSIDDVDCIKSDSYDNYIANCKGIRSWSNRYTNSVISTMTANNNEITITNDVFKDDNATFEFMFEPTLNASSEYEYLTLSKYELDTTAGTIKITVETAPTVNTRVRVDVTTYRA